MTWVWSNDQIHLILSKIRYVTHFEINPSNHVASSSGATGAVIKVYGLPVRLSESVPENVILALDDGTVMGHVRGTMPDVHLGDIPGCGSCCVMDVMDW